MVSRHWLYFGGSVLAGFVFLVVGIVGVVDTLSTMIAGLGSGGSLVAVLQRAVAWTVTTALVGLLSACLGVASVVSFLRSVSRPRSERLGSLAARVERAVPPLARFGLAAKLGPRPEDRIETLKERYVAGELDDVEFEMALERVLESDAGLADARPTSRAAVEVEDVSK